MLCAPRASAGVVDNSPAGQWCEILNSRMDGVQPSPLPPNSGGFRAVVEDWNGGAFDTNRERLIVWGGGHNSYAGNEIYTFDLDDTHPFTLPGRATLVLNTSGVLGLSGQSGSVTVTHDGGYGGLVGKAVSLEPATGYSFDSPLTARAR